MKANITVRTLLSMECKVTKWRRTSPWECCCTKIMPPYDSKHCKNVSTNGMHSNQMKANITMRTLLHKEHGIIWRQISLYERCYQWNTKPPNEGECHHENVTARRQCYHMKENVTVRILLSMKGNVIIWPDKKKMQGKSTKTEQLKKKKKSVSDKASYKNLPP